MECTFYYIGPRAGREPLSVQFIAVMYGQMKLK